VEKVIKIPDINCASFPEDFRVNLVAASGAIAKVDGLHCRGLSGGVAQVLLAAVRQWKSDGKVLNLRVSDEIKSDLVRLGLAQEILGLEDGYDH